LTPASAEETAADAELTAAELTAELLLTTPAELLPELDEPPDTPNCVDHW